MIPLLKVAPRTRDIYTSVRNTLNSFHGRSVRLIIYDMSGITIELSFGIKQTGFALSVTTQKLRMNNYEDMAEVK